MNTQLVDSLVQVILSLSQEERTLLEKKLFFDSTEPSTQELIQLAQTSDSFDFLRDEPDIYTLKDSEREFPSPFMGRDESEVRI